MLQIVWPPWKYIMITGTSVGLSFRMQILSAYIASVILVLVQIVYCEPRGTVKRESCRRAVGSLFHAWLGVFSLALKPS